MTVPLLLLFAGGWWLPKTVDAGPHLSTGPSVVIDVLLLALFGLQHSGMARPSFKAFVTRWVPEAARAHRLHRHGQPGRVGARAWAGSRCRTGSGRPTASSGWCSTPGSGSASCWSTRPPCC